MRIAAPAKINLDLRVGAARADGFHPLVTWMCTVGLFDTLSFERSSGSGFSLRCQGVQVPCDARNLVVRAAAALAGRAGGLPPIEAVLEKRIPMGAGLGGGSSNAAAALVALNDLCGLGLRPQALHELAAQLGSDVPFFLHAPSSICTGRGEIVRPTPRPRVEAVLLMLPPYSVATPAAYRQFDQMSPRGADLSDEPDYAAWAAMDAGQLLAALRNDLEPPAFAIVPELGRLRDNAADLLQRIVRMSGSGSSLFTLYDTLPQAEFAAELVRRELGLTVVTAPVAPREETGGNEAASAV